MKWKSFLCSPDFQLLPYACLSPCKNLCVLAPTWQVLFRRWLCPLSALSWEVGGQMKKKNEPQRKEEAYQRLLRGGHSSVIHQEWVKWTLGPSGSHTGKKGYYSVWFSQPLTQAGKGALKWGPEMPSWCRISSLPGQPMLAFLLGPQ